MNLLRCSKCSLENPESHGRDRDTYRCRYKRWILNLAAGSVAGTDSQVMNEQASEKMSGTDKGHIIARGAGSQGEAGNRWDIQVMTTITTVTIINEQHRRRTQFRCNDDDDERQRAVAIKLIPPANWYL